MRIIQYVATVLVSGLLGIVVGCMLVDIFRTVS